ncbi:shikimate kinase [Tateyamaria sp. ANG-S1]|uniref:shikimate kinase n=1 Tax=Tateyamaria sp. ANG-S1 TaxID=1577905 RepID=UPI00068ABCEC|nr:shikimate kinase [Tateyamaria sp. ANG-S1]
MEKHVFLIGPGGIGKTSTGPFLARLIGREFVDLDQEFMVRIGHIGRYIRQHGYAAYVRQNADLLLQHVAGRSSPAVVALSSGFLIAETEHDTVMKNRQIVKDLGHTVMPLPYHDIERCADIVTARQVGRGFNLQRSIERPKFLARVAVYRTLVDHIVVSQGRPEEVARDTFMRISNADTALGKPDP